MAFSKGHLVFLRDNRLVAQPLNLNRFELTGQCQTHYRTSRTRRRVVHAILTYGVWRARPPTGLRFLVPSSSGWTAKGEGSGRLENPADYGDIVLSPDGRRAAVSVLDAAVNTQDMWVFDISRGVRSRVTFESVRRCRGGMVAGQHATCLRVQSRRGTSTSIGKPPQGLATRSGLIFQDESEKYPSAWSPDWPFGPVYGRLAVRVHRCAC